MPCCRAADVKRRCDRLHHTEPSTHPRLCGKKRERRRDGATLQPNLGEALMAKGLLLLRLPEGLRQRRALL